MADKNSVRKTVAANRKAFHDYFVDETFEAGVALFGTEIKSIRAGQVNLKDSYCTVRNGELFALGIHISPYEKGNIFNREPLRERKLLMHRREIRRLEAEMGQKGCTLVPLSLYFSGSKIKMELGLCRGKKLYDKRETDAKNQANREIERYEKSMGRE